MIFGTWELHSQAPKMTERFWESAVRNLFRRTNPTMNQIYRNKCGFTALTKRKPGASQRWLPSLTNARRTSAPPRRQILIYVRKTICKIKSHTEKSAWLLLFELCSCVGDKSLKVLCVRALFKSNVHRNGSGLNKLCKLLVHSLHSLCFTCLHC